MSYTYMNSNEFDVDRFVALVHVNEPFPIRIVI